MSRIDRHQLRIVYEVHGAALVLYARQWCVYPDDALQDAEQRESWFTTDPTASIGSNEIESLLSELPALEREIVVARIWGEMSFEQIAELVERSLSFVYRRYQQALRELEKKIDGQVKKLS